MSVMRWPMVRINRELDAVVWTIHMYLCDEGLSCEVK